MVKLFALRSRPVGYAAEYLTLASDCHNMCRFWSMSMKYTIPYLVTFGLPPAGVNRGKSPF